MPNILTSEAVEKVFIDSMYRKEEIVIDGQRVQPEDAILVEGIMNNFGFHPQRVESHREEIEAFLMELPDDFRSTGGGGTSFLNACYDRHENHWGEHHNMEQLFVLGLAIGKVSMPMPRDFWSALPGGMPYYTVICDQPKEASV